MATTDKYDRQLRLWGAKGQRALGETTVVLIRATAAGTETVKNLVLPGVGQIMVIDDTMESSVRSNFFVSSKTSKPRAQVAMELLNELNPDVKGHYKHLNKPLVETDLKQILAEIPSNKKLVVAADLEPPLLLKVSVACSDLNLCLVVVQSYGLIGLVRVQAPPMPILDPKPDSVPPDLRLVHGFPELHELANSIQWDTLTRAEYGHVPYPFILMRALEQWKQSHNDKLPQTFAEKQEFRSTIKEASRKFHSDPLNFAEASDMAYLAYTERTLDTERLKELMQAAESNDLGNLQLLLQALETFMGNHDGQVPLPGNIPDMVASTDLYVRLQGIYQKKAARDLAEMRSFVPSSISDDDLVTFTKNVHSLDVLLTRTLQQEYSNSFTEEQVEDWAMATFDPYEVPEHTPILWYMALRACQLYYTRHGRYPGVTENYEADVDEVQQCMQEVVAGMRLGDNELVQQTLLNKTMAFSKEMTRYANAEIHTIASVVGGVASQEAVKIITGQYVPLNNTFIYNGIASTGGVYRF